MILVDDILKLTKQLLPTGRAFRVPKNGTFENLLKGLAASEANVINFALSTLDRILPDNDNFTAIDAAEWERRLALTIYPDYVSLENRKALILRKYQFPGNKLCRQNLRYIQQQLQDAGFNVFVHENLNGVTPLIFEIEFQHGFDTQMGVDTEMGSSDIDLIANSTYRGERFDLNDSKGCFFICGEVFPNHAIISPDLVESFRRLVLSLKPANTVAVCLIDYVHSGRLVFMNGNQIGLMNGNNLQLMSYA